MNGIVFSIKQKKLHLTKWISVIGWRRKKSKLSNRGQRSLFLPKLVAGRRHHSSSKTWRCWVACLRLGNCKVNWRVKTEYLWNLNRATSKRVLWLRKIRLGTVLVNRPPKSKIEMNCIRSQISNPGTEPNTFKSNQTY